MSVRVSKLLSGHGSIRNSNQRSRRNTGEVSGETSRQVSKRKSEKEAELKQEFETVAKQGESQKDLLQDFRRSSEPETSQTAEEECKRGSDLSELDKSYQQYDVPETPQIKEKSSERKRTEITFKLPRSQPSINRGSEGNAATQPRITRMFRSSLFIGRQRRSTYVRPVVKYQPTYQLQEPNNPFNPPVVEDILKAVVESHMESLGKINFESKASLSICRTVSEEVLNRVKAKYFDRYRILVTATVGEKFNQSFRESAAFLWDSEKDAFANYVYERAEIFVIATVYGVYYD